MTSSRGLIPVPASIRSDSSAAPFILASGLVISGDGDAPEVLAGLISRRTGLSPQVGAAGEISFQLIAGGPAEGYGISVTDTSITVSAGDAAGLFYAAHTLGQLITPEGDGWVIPATEIEDRPRFAYRGVMLDVARHFFAVDTIKAYIDRAAALKLNHLHLHLSDDQGWRLELTRHPLLTQLASATEVGGGQGGFYTQDDYREIVGYAASRHMIVVPEIDVPGHTHAVGVAYPELAEAPVLSEHVREVVREFGGELPTPGVPYDGMAVGFSSLKIHDERTYAFLSEVFEEVAELTPGPYIHLGGDEALGTAPEDFATFIARTAGIVAATGKTPVAWHEAGAVAGLPSGMIGQYWGFTTPADGHDAAALAFVEHGGRVILSPSDAVYLDMKYDASTALGLTWANGPTSIARAYDWEPTAVIADLDEAGVLGVEAPLWTETIRNLADIETMAFPRIAAAAEIAWSPAPSDCEERTWESFRTRVGALGPLWASEGIGFFASPEIDWIDESA